MAVARTVVPPALSVLLAAVSMLVLLHVLVTTLPPPVSHFRVWFDLGRENSIASWFAAAQLLAAGLGFGLAAWWHWHERPERWLLAVAALGFVFLSADETAMIHERITRFTRYYPIVPRFPGDHGVWIFAYGAVGVALVAGFCRSILSFLRWRPAVALLVASGFASLVLGAVAFEVLMYYGAMTGPLQVVLEEALELAGGALVVCGALLLVAPLLEARPHRP